MCETLLGVINSQNPGTAEALIGAKRIVQPQEVLMTNTHLQQKMLDLESNI
jgi:hypothetical protein